MSVILHFSTVDNLKVYLQLKNKLMVDLTHRADPVSSDEGLRGKPRKESI